MRIHPYCHVITGVTHRLPKTPTLWPTYFHLILRGNGRNFDIKTHLTEVERLVLYKLALQVPRGSSIVEIGSYLGASSCFLAAAAVERRSNLFCVDTWQNDAMTEGRRDTYQEFLSNTQRYRHVISPIRQRSEDAATEFSRVISFLFVDADHKYDAVVSDLRCWLPKLCSGAWLVLHDWGWAIGVQRAIEELVLPIQVAKPIILPNLYAVRVKPHNIRVDNVA